MRKQGLLVVRRFQPEDLAPLRRSMEIAHGGGEISGEQALKVYRGFDGLHLWPKIDDIGDITLDGALAPVSQLSTVLQYVSAVPAETCDVLFCDVISDLGSEQCCPVDRPFLGFDYGWLESEYDRFSVVLHEVVFGSIQRMREYTNLLNRNLLFDSLRDIVALAAERERYKNREGQELESVDEDVRLVAVGIYDVTATR